MNYQDYRKLADKHNVRPLITVTGQKARAFINSLGVTMRLPRIGYSADVLEVTDNSDYPFKSNNTLTLSHDASGYWFNWATAW